MQKLKKILIVITIFTLYACSDDPSTIGSSLLIDDLIGVSEYNAYIDTTANNLNYIKEVNLGGNARLFLGKKDNAEAYMLLRFQISLPDSIKNDIKNNLVTVTSAYINMTKQYTFGSATSSFGITGNRILKSWNSTNVKFADVNVAGFAEQTSMLTGTPNFSDTLCTLGISNSVALDWLKFADSTDKTDDGILIKPTSSTEVIYGFQALTSEDNPVPRLYVVLTKQGSYVDTLDFIPTSDVSVQNRQIPNHNGNIVIQGGYEMRSRIYFKVDGIPKGAIINKAELILTADTLKQEFGTPHNVAIYAYDVVDTVNYDSLNSTVSYVSQGSGVEFSGDLTYIVQRWVNSNNYAGSLILRPYDYGTSLELYSFKGSNSAINVRPRIKIIYTSKK